MGIITAYALFALTTAICAFYELLYPVILALRSKSDSTIATKQPILTYITLFCLGFIFAPIMLLPCIIPSMGTIFRDALETSLSEA